MRLNCRNKIIVEMTGLRRDQSVTAERSVLIVRDPVPLRLYACCGASVVTAQDAVYRRKALTIRTSKTVRKSKTPSAGKRPPGLDALQRDGQCIRVASYSRHRRKRAWRCDNAVTRKFWMHTAELF
jgi:hypothetical protein